MVIVVIVDIAVNKYTASSHFETSNHFFHSLTKNSTETLKATQQFGNPVLNELE